MMRLDKFLSDNTSFSRSEIKNLIKKGSVTVNKATVVAADFKITPEADNISLNGEQVLYKRFVYLMLNKPAGILSAGNDKRRETVVDLVPQRYRHYNLFPVGRLDKDTTGLLILTNDGDFAHKVISPKSNIEKSYIATLDGGVTSDMISAFSSGVVLADGTVCKPAILEKITDNTARVIITEGKYHQIKRMFGVVGLGVNSLHRERIGKLFLPENLPAGSICELNVNEICLISPTL